MDRNAGKNGEKNASFWRRALQGAGIATFLVFMILGMSVGIETSYFGWNTLSILMVPVAGAFGGLVFHFMEPFRKKGIAYEIIIFAVSIISFLLFLGIAFYVV